MNVKAVAIAIFAIVVMLAIPTPKANAVTCRNYPNCGIVTEIDKGNDLVIFQDFSGQEWSFRGAEDYMVGDVVAVIMSDNGTESIYDDTIITAKYCG